MFGKTWCSDHVSLVHLPTSVARGWGRGTMMEPHGPHGEQEAGFPKGVNVAATAPISELKRTGRGLP